VTGPKIPGLRIRPAGARDRSWIEQFLDDNHSLRVARRGELVSPLDHPMLIAARDGIPVGLLTFILEGETCEIRTLHAVERFSGVGTALVEAVVTTASRSGCRMVWVVTTNDNLDALRFYQRRGFRIRNLRPGAVDSARQSLKPEIPEIGEYGIRIRSEIELERSVPPA
jgi:N-acetylglutamate synthase-like GNAT family acetyltransferase